MDGDRGERGNLTISEALGCSHVSGLKRGDSTAALM
jgi:hypothetical protein